MTGKCVIESDGTIVTFTTSVADRTADGYSLDAITPSPVIENGTLNFTLAKEEMTRISITDIFGREVAILHNGMRPAGAQAITFSTNDLKLTSGIYMYTVETATFRATRQMIVVK